MEPELGPFALKDIIVLDFLHKKKKPMCATENKGKYVPRLCPARCTLSECTAGSKAGSEGSCSCCAVEGRLASGGATRWASGCGSGCGSSRQQSQAFFKLRTQTLFQRVSVCVAASPKNPLVLKFLTPSVVLQFFVVGPTKKFFVVVSRHHDFQMCTKGVLSLLVCCALPPCAQTKRVFSFLDLFFLVSSVAESKCKSLLGGHFFVCVIRGEVLSSNGCSFSFERDLLPRPVTRAWRF